MQTTIATALLYMPDVLTWDGTDNIYYGIFH